MSIKEIEEYIHQTQGGCIRIWCRNKSKKYYYMYTVLTELNTINLFITNIREIAPYRTILKPVKPKNDNNINNYFLSNTLMDKLKLSIINLCEDDFNFNISIEEYNEGKILFIDIEKDIEPLESISSLDSKKYDL